MELLLGFGLSTEVKLEHAACPIKLRHNKRYYSNVTTTSQGDDNVLQTGGSPAECSQMYITWEWDGEVETKQINKAKRPAV